MIISKPRSARRRATARLQAETLEQRVVLHGFSLPLGTPSQLTLSFAQDGVDIGGDENSLFESFNQKFGQEQAWQTTILSAFQTWFQHTNLDVGLIEEEGSFDFGAAGPRSGDDRFGDIRIGSRALDEGTIAVAIDHGNLVSGTWAGDMIFNESLSQIESLDDLYSVTLHEVGHVLGLDHSDNPDSPMHIHGVSPVTDLQASDIDAVQAIYGMPSPDGYERSNGNDTIRRAANLRLNAAPGQDPGSAPSVAYANIHVADDVDYYRIAMPFDYSGNVTVELSTSGISLLDARLTVLDSRGRALATVNPAEQSDDGIQRYSIPSETLGNVGYARVERTANNPFNVGGYSLSVEYDDLTNIESETIEELARARRRSRIDEDAVESFFGSEDRAFRNDRRSNDHPSDAGEFDRVRITPTARNLEAIGTLSDDGDVDHYRFVVPRMHNNGSLSAHIAIRSLNPGQLIPSVTLLTDRREVVPLETLVNGNGELLVLAESLPQDRGFVIKVDSEGGISAFQAGNYELSLTLTDDADHLDRFASGRVEVGSSQTHQLHVATSQLFHFALTVDGDDSRSGLQLQIVDESGKVAHEIVAPQGTTRTAGSVLLGSGQYEVVATVLSQATETVSVNFWLDGAVVSEPLGIDPAEGDDTEYKCLNIETVYCYPDGTETNVPYDWDELLVFIGEQEWSGGEIDQTLLLSWWNTSLQATEETAAPETDTDEYSIDQRETLIVPASSGVLQNDSTDGSILISSTLTAPQHGVLTLNYDGSFTYTPDDDFFGVDRFEYVATNLFKESLPVQVDIFVGVTPLTGDLNGDTKVNALDIDRMTGILASGASDRDHDLNGDGDVDTNDRDFLIANLLGSQYGDVNLDGVFNSADLVLVFQAGAYANDFVDVGWGAGDWNGDSKFDSSDLTIAFQTGYSN